MSDARRAVLVAAIPQVGDKALAATLESIARLGWTLVGMITPDRHLDALRLVVDGEADMVVVTRPEYLPAVQFAADLDVTRTSEVRTRRLPRPDVAAQRIAELPRGRRRFVS